MRIGVRAHDIDGVQPAERLATAVAKNGFCSVQLTLDDALEGFSYRPGCLNTGLAYHVEEAFRREGVQIAVFSCYINPVHPDPGQRRLEIAKFREYVRFARDFGCGLVATETGSCRTDGAYDPWNHSEEGFNCFLESLREMVSEAERFGVQVCIEGVERFVVHDPKSIRRMLDCMPTNNLQILFDPVNLLSPRNYTDRMALVEESLALFGERIAAFHAKDFVIRDGRMERVPIGEGLMDFRPILRYIREQKPYVNVIVEEYWPAGAVASLHYLQTCDKEGREAQR